MQATSIVSTASTESTSSAVVLNDTTVVSDSMPSIKLGTKANVKVNAKPAVNSPIQRLREMETAVRNWETTELAASNKRKYLILTDAYSYYLTMKTNPVTETRNNYASDLARFIEQRGYVFSPTSHDLNRVVKCVFGVDRRRVSAYSIALREALRQEIGADDLVEFIEQNGGVEQIRLGGTKPLSAKIRAGKVKEEVLGAELGAIKFDARLVKVDADWADKQVVIVATYLPTGEFQANAVIRHDTAVNAALAAYYSKQQAAIRADAKAEREAVLKQEAELKKAANRVSREVARNAPQHIKNEKRAGKVLKKMAQKKSVAATAEFAKTLMV